MPEENQELTVKLELTKREIDVISEGLKNYISVVSRAVELGTDVQGLLCQEARTILNDLLKAKQTTNQLQPKPKRQMQPPQEELRKMPQQQPVPKYQEEYEDEGYEEQ